MDPHTGGPDYLPDDGGTPRRDADAPDSTGTGTAGPKRSGPGASGPGAQGAGAPGSGASGGGARPPAAPRQSLPALGADGPAGTPVQGRGITELVVGDYLLTVNPVDGSEVRARPLDQKPPVPPKRTAKEREAVAAAARPVPPPGSLTRGRTDLVERDDEQERLVRLLARGRSVRLTGPSGSGRTALLDAVAEECEEERFAPDGVVRLHGRHRGPADLLQELCAAVHRTDGYRPAPDALADLVRGIGAIVVVDDLEFGGAQLEELLAGAPECAFLLSALPDVPEPAAGSGVEEVPLTGLSRSACLEMLAQRCGRSLEDDEAAWAADLWFESEGLPLRFVQAAELLAQRDEAGAAPDGPASGPSSGGRGDDGETDVWGSGSAGAEHAPEAGRPPLPSLAESAAPARLFASRLSASARETLRFAVVLDGECPDPAHLPALVGDTHADTAPGELLDCGLLTAAASRYRLAAGVRPQLLAAAGDGPAEQALTAARHYAWWAGHPSVTTHRVAQEADAVLAAMAAARDTGHPSAAVLLARTAAPVFAAALHWTAWERTLRIGQEAARLTGDVAEEAYFHHELGVLALCTGNPDRARSELEASIGLRGALADRTGVLVGRRTLALVVDVTGEADTLGGTGAGSAADESAAAVTTVLPALAARAAKGRPPASATASRRPAGASAAPAQAPAPAPAPVAGRAPGGVRGLLQAGPRRNVVAACAGALLVAVLGTVVTLGSTAAEGPQDNTPMNVAPDESAEQEERTQDGPPGQQPAGPVGPSGPAPSGTGPSGTADPSASASEEEEKESESPTPGKSTPAKSTSPSPGGSSSSGGTTGGGTTGGGGSTGGTTGGSGGTGDTGASDGTSGSPSAEPSSTGEPSGGADAGTGDTGTTEGGTTNSASAPAEGGESVAYPSAGGGTSSTTPA
ncbi:ATP-binding protein [Streptomyces thermolineatus]|uniref:ATP-binding protein n=1 Tax=Streptomyces thermolineatus TaxID=44033 RepID=UPI00385104EC